MTPRADLLALRPDTLAALANRGLLKRAAKEVAAGTGPTVTCADDGTVHAVHPDGTTTALPPGTALDAGPCSCGAPGVCRHRIALVLAYQQQEAGRTDAGAPERDAPAGPSSPGAIDDEALAAAFGPRALTAARRALRREPCTVRLHRGTPGDPQPRAELPSCTVRFPVPGEPGFAVTDAADARRGEVVALAVWAFRTADATAGPDGDPHPVVTLGAPAGATGRPGSADTLDAALGAALDLAGELLLEGTAHTGPVLAAAVRRCRDDLAAAALHWPAGVLDDLADGLDAYAARSAAHRPRTHALLLGELHARHRAAGHRDGAPRAEVLGSREVARTPLRRVRLTALGCRIRGTAGDRTAEVLLAHPRAGTVLVLRRRWAAPEDGPAPTGHRLAGRRVAGARLDALASGNLVSEHATRSAGRLLEIGRGPVAGTSVTPVGAAWTELPEPLLVHDLHAHLRGLAGRPPRLLRPRIAAESVRVVRLSAVEEIGYDPGEQVLHAAVRDAAGRPATVRADHHPACPGALDALAGALGGGGVTHVAAAVERVGGRILLDPFAVLADGVVVVPDLAAGEGTGGLAAAPEPVADPLAAALDEALDALADAAHRGLRHPDGTVLTGLERAAARLARTGLDTGAALLRGLAGGLRADEPERAARTWADAQIRLAVSAELHRESGPRQ